MDIFEIDHRRGAGDGARPVDLNAAAADERAFRAPDNGEGVRAVERKAPCHDALGAGEHFREGPT